MNTYIGITGLARSGKNMFADILSSILNERLQYTTEMFALAHVIKKDCESFVKDKLNLSVWSEKTEDKNVFRDLLVWYGKVKREQTKGRHWIDMLTNHMDKSNVDVKIITDIRYAAYENDELSWLRNELNGKLIHVSKYSIVDEQIIYNTPPNTHEAIQDPILKKAADVIFEWKDMSDIPYQDKIADINLRNRIFDECVKPIFKIVDIKNVS